jgi:hypothetical protein
VAYGKIEPMIKAAAAAAEVQARGDIEALAELVGREMTELGERVRRLEENVEQIKRA